MATSFPASPYLNQIVDRHDLNYLCRWNGSQWLTVHEYDLVCVPRSAQPWSIAEVLELPAAGPYARKFSHVIISTLVNTTNNGSNYWTVTPRNGETGASLASAVNTISGGTTNWQTQTISLSAVASTSAKVDVILGKVGAPGTIYAGAVYRYRLVIP